EATSAVAGGLGRADRHGGSGRARHEQVQRVRQFATDQSKARHAIGARSARCRALRRSEDLTEQPVVRELLERCTFPAAGTSVTCAVSGGPDSMALLVLATEAGCDVTAVHVDHGLREGSAKEADVVAAAAARFGAAFE